LLRLERNAITGKYPGELQGSYKIRMTPSRTGDRVRITGYGADTEPTTNFAQQTSAGPITELSGTAMRYAVDTRGGNSGSSVIREDTEEIVAIHTHGGCSGQGGANQSTWIATHPTLKKAIRRALAED